MTESDIETEIDLIISAFLVEFSSRFPPPSDVRRWHLVDMLLDMRTDLYHKMFADYMLFKLPGGVRTAYSHAEVVTLAESVRVP